MKSSPVVEKPRPNNLLEDIYHLFDAVPFAVAVLKGESLIIEFINQYNLNIWGSKKEDVIGKPLFEVRPEIRSGAEPIHTEIYKTGKRFTAKEIPLEITANGKTETRYFNTVIDPMHNEQGKIIGQLATSIEITEQVLARKKVEESEVKYRGLFETIDQGFCMIEMIFNEANHPVDYRILESNPVFEKQTGLSDVIGKTALQLVPNLEKRWFDIYGTVARTGVATRFTEGSEAMGRWFEVYAFPIGEYVSHKVAIIFTDITEHKKIETSLKESEERFRSLADESPMFVFITEPDPQAKVSYWNKTWLNYTGQTFEEAKGRAWDGIIHPDDVPLVMDIYVPAFETRQAYLIPAIRVKRHDDVYRWHSFKGNPRFLPAGEFNGYVGVGFDIHEQKLAEEKLAYRTALLEAHNQANVDGVLLVDAKGKIISYNQRFIEIWNMPQHIVDAKDDEAALSFAMTQLVNPQQFIEKVKYLYSHPTETSIDELEYKNGKIVERNGYPVLGQDGTYYAWSWMFKDVTKQRQNEKNIKESEERFRTFSNNIQNLAWIADGDGWIFWYNQRWYDYTGTTLEEMQGWGWEKVHHPDHIEKVVAYVTEAWKLPEPFELTFPLKGVDGKYQWFLTRCVPVLDADGKIYRWIGTNTNINEQKLAEEKTKESEERFRSLANSLPQLAWMTDAEGWIYWYNQRWYDYTGTTLEEMQGWGWRTVHHPDLVEGVIERFKKAVEGGMDWEDTFLIRGKDGEYRWFLSRALPIRNDRGEIVNWFGTNTDISGQRKIEHALQNAKEQLELTFRNVPSAIYHFDKTGNIIYLNEKGARQMGYETVEDVLAEKNVYQFRKKLDETFTVLDEWGKPLPADQSSAALAFKTGKSSEVLAEFINKKTGSSLWLLSKSAPLYDDQGELFMVLTTATDITPQKTSEQFIRQSEEKFRTLAETLPQLIWITDEKGEQEYASKQWEEYTGIAPSGAGSWQEIVHPDDLPAITKAWMNSIAFGGSYRSEARLRSKSGEYRWHFVQGEPIRNEKGNVIKWIGAFTDIHDQKESEQKLEALVAQRTLDLERSNENLQQFAHVASHDLKEPVRKIKTFAGRLQEETKDSLNDRGKIYLDKVQSAADRMFTMIDGVLTYSTMNASEQPIEKVDVNQVFKNIETDLEVLIHQKKAVIQYQKLPFIEGASVLLYQLFYNLLNNSLKFSKKDESPQIAVSAHIIKEDEIEMAEIILKDNGIGFDAENSELIFNTFARLHSKDKYEGTGLGLALSKKIVERHHGRIHARSVRDQGSEFIVVLPLKQKHRFV